MNDIATLALELGNASRTVASGLVDAFKQAGDEFRDDWKENAVLTSGETGKHYPNSITAESRIALGIEIEVGPDPSMKQGGMSFEFGSRNQPPHLDGARALPNAGARLERMASTTIAYLLP